MSKLYILLILSFFSIHSFSQHWVTADLIGGQQNEELGNIASDNDGYLYATGVFSGECYIANDTIYANGLKDIFLVKYNNVNDPVWVRQIQGPDVNNLLYSRIIGFDNANNIYLAGYFYGEITVGNKTLESEGGTDIFLSKFSSMGDHIWTKHEGTHKYEGVISGSVDKSGNIVLAGFFYDFTKFGNNLLFGSGNRDIFLVKYNNLGNVMWAKAEGGHSVDYISDITSGPANNIYMSGYFSASTTFQDTTISSAGGTDIFLVKYNPFGKVVWARQAGGTSNDYSQSIYVDDDYHSYICGYFSDTIAFDTISLYSDGDSDIFIAKFDSDGDVLWANHAGSTEQDKCNSISVDNFDNSYVTGYSYGSISFANTTLIHQGGKDAFLAIIDKDGEYLAAKQMAGIDNEIGKSVMLDDDGRVFVSGEYNCPIIYFDNLSLSNVNSNDIFIAELSTSSYISCVADFASYYDSINFQFEFTDLSVGEIIRWSWDFGDGDTSDLQSPVHSFDDYGNYDVCLVITAINPFSTTYCSDTICKQVEYGKPTTYNLGGQVFAGIYPLDDGIAYLYRCLSNNYILPADTIHFDTLGYFYFYQIIEGTYIVKVDPEFYSSAFKTISLPIMEIKPIGKVLII